MTRHSQLSQVTAIAIAALLLTSCSESSPADPSGVSDASVKDSVSFRTASGLFRMPEARSAVATFATTAQYIDVLGPSGGRVVDWKKIASAPAPSAGSDLVDVESYLRIQKVSGTKSLGSAELSALTRGAVVPPPQNDAGSEIGALWAWTSAWSTLRSMGSTIALDPHVVARVGSIAPASITGSPYLQRRLTAIYASLGLKTPPALVASLAGPRQTPLPYPDSLRNLLDAEAILEESPGPSVKTKAPAEFVQQITKLLENSSALDPTSEAAALRLLQLAGATSQLPPFLDKLRARSSADSGLIHDARPEQGSVEATYLFSRLVDLRFPEISNQGTRDSLNREASNAANPVAVRLMSAAALKRSGDERWKVFAPLATKSAAEQPKMVSREQLSSYLSVIMPATDLQPDLPKAALRPFEPRPGDEGAEKDAVGAINNSYLFSNTEAVEQMFPTVQSHLTAWVDNPATPFPQVVAAAAALSGARLVKVDSPYLNRVGKKIAERRGCKDARTLLPATGRADGACSLILTVQARAIPSAF